MRTVVSVTGPTASDERLGAWVSGAGGVVSSKPLTVTALPAGSVSTTLRV